MTDEQVEAALRAYRTARVNMHPGGDADWMRAALEAAEAAAWRPIKEAPRSDIPGEFADTKALLWSREIGHVVTGTVFGWGDCVKANASGYHGDWNITHYRDIPAPPKDPSNVG